jgi:hypothetical protein
MRESLINYIHFEGLLHNTEETTRLLLRALLLLFPLIIFKHLGDALKHNGAEILELAERIA